jgi:hypothetical protein
MNRKKYQKPTMAVVKCQHSGCLLVGSGNGDPTPPGNGEMGYIPGDAADMNSMA